VDTAIEAKTKAAPIGATANKQIANIARMASTTFSQKL
jgi:hypothetical protein